MSGSLVFNGSPIFSLSRGRLLLSDYWNACNRPQAEGASKEKSARHRRYCDGGSNGGLNSKKLIEICDAESIRQTTAGSQHDDFLGGWVFLPERQQHTHRGSIEMVCFGQVNDDFRDAFTN